MAPSGAQLDWRMRAHFGKPQAFAHHQKNHKKPLIKTVGDPQAMRHDGGFYVIELELVVTTVHVRLHRRSSRAKAMPIGGGLKKKK